MKKLFESEPLRLIMYPLLILICGYLLHRGWITKDDMDFIVSAGGLIAGAFGIELIRSQVTSPATLQRDYGPAA